MAEEKGDTSQKSLISVSKFFTLVSTVIAYAGHSLLLNPGDGFYFIQPADGWEESAIYPWGPAALTVPLILWWALTAIQSGNRWSLECCAFFVIMTFGMCLAKLGYSSGGAVAIGAIVLACIRTLVFLMDGGFVPEESPESEAAANSLPATHPESTEPEDA